MSIPSSQRCLAQTLVFNHLFCLEPNDLIWGMSRTVRLPNMASWGETREARGVASAEKMLPFCGDRVASNGMLMAAAIVHEDPLFVEG